MFNFLDTKETRETLSPEALTYRVHELSEQFKSLNQMLIKAIEDIEILKTKMEFLKNK